MGTTVKRVNEALRRAGLRHAFDRIERTRDGEIICWAGMGYPVRTPSEAVALAREFVLRR